MTDLPNQIISQVFYLLCRRRGLASWMTLLFGWDCALQWQDALYIARITDGSEGHVVIRWTVFWGGMLSGYLCPLSPAAGRCDNDTPRIWHTCSDQTPMCKDTQSREEFILRVPLLYRFTLRPSGYWTHKKEHKIQLVCDSDMDMAKRFYAVMLKWLIDNKKTVI